MPRWERYNVSRERHKLHKVGFKPAIPERFHWGQAQRGAGRVQGVRRSPFSPKGFNPTLGQRI